MTTPTEAELDALVETSNSLNCCHDTQHESGDEGPNNRCLFCGHRFADAITALRAELAAERARAIEAVEAHFPGRLYASSRMDCIAAITATKGAIK